MVHFVEGIAFLGSFWEIFRELPLVKSLLYYKLFPLI